MIEYSYRGVNGIRPAGIKFEYTAEQVAELIKCGNDPIYFCKNYLQIITLDDGLQLFEPREYQENFINLIRDERFLLCKMSRQSGKCVKNTTLIKIRNKKTGEIIETTIENFYSTLNNQGKQENMLLNKKEPNEENKNL